MAPKKKRSPPSVSGSAAKKTKTSNTTVFIVCPGAGGVLPKDGTLEAQLGKLGRVVVLPSDVGYSGLKGCLEGQDGMMNVNLQALTKEIRKIIREDLDDQIVLVGQSFGCRVIVHWLSANHEVRKAPSIPTPWKKPPQDYQHLKERIKCAILFGYPLHHKSQDRSAALKLLPTENRALLVTGTADKMALGEKLDTDSFEDVLSQCDAKMEVFWIEKGGHSLPNTKKWNSTRLAEKVESFVEE